MSFFDNMMNRAYEELAKASIKREKDMREKLKKDAMQQSQEQPPIQQTEPIEEVVATVEEESVVMEDISQDEIVVDTEASVEEQVSEHSEEPVRPTVIPSEWNFKPDTSLEEQQAVRVISQMPETTLEESLAKAVEWYHFKNHEAQVIEDTVLIAPTVAHMALSSLHQYDKDGGVAWEENDKLHGFKEFENLSMDMMPLRVDVKTYGLSEEQRQLYMQPSHQELQSNEQQQDSVQEEQVKETDTPKVQVTKDEIPFANEEVATTVIDPETGEVWAHVDVTIKDTTPGSNDHAWEDGYQERFGGTRTLNENGMVEYDGVLGKFTYDSDQFQLQVVKVDEDEFGNPASSYPILKYIGKEVDGQQIHIPEGLRDGAFMFEGNTQLQSIPKLPSSLENGFGMFMNCESLQSAATIKMPTKLQDTQFMFANCHGLEVGPLVVNVKDATGMFVNCTSLAKTPKITQGLKFADSMFAGCESLTKKPVWPSSVQYADYATKGCTGIDDAERVRAAKQMEKDSERFEAQKNKKTLSQHLGSVFSACMQVHAMQKSGLNVFHAILMTKAMRKSGQFTRDMAGGWSALCHAHRTNFNQYMMMTSRQFAQKKMERDTERNAELQRAFDATHSDVKQSTKADRLMYNNGRRAMQGHYFEKVASKGYSAIQLQTSAAKADADELRAVLSMREKAGNLNASAKTYYGKQAVEMVSNQLSYYKGAQDVLKDKQLSQELNPNLCGTGLKKVSNANMEMIAQTITELQNDHHFLNERQFHTICQLMEQSPYGKTKSYEQFKQSFTASMSEREQKFDSLNASAMKSYRRPKEGASQRGKDAEARFSWVNGKEDTSEFSL